MSHHYPAVCNTGCCNPTPLNKCRFEARRRPGSSLFHSPQGCRPYFLVPARAKASASLPTLSPSLIILNFREEKNQQGRRARSRGPRHAEGRGGAGRRVKNRCSALVETASRPGAGPGRPLIGPAAMLPANGGRPRQARHSRHADWMQNRPRGRHRGHRGHHGRHGRSSRSSRSSCVAGVPTLEARFLKRGRKRLQNKAAKNGGAVAGTVTAVRPTVVAATSSRGSRRDATAVERRCAALRPRKDVMAWGGSGGPRGQ